MLAEEITEGHSPGEASQPGTQQARSPGVQGPSLVGGGSTGSQVSPVRTPHGLELLPGSVEWTWARGAGSGQPGLPSLSAAAGTQLHGGDCRTQAAGAQGYAAWGTAKRTNHQQLPEQPAYKHGAWVQPVCLNSFRETKRTTSRMW